MTVQSMVHHFFTNFIESLGLTENDLPFPPHVNYSSIKACAQYLKTKIINILYKGELKLQKKLIKKLLICLHWNNYEDLIEVNMKFIIESN